MRQEENHPSLLSIIFLFSIFIIFCSSFFNLSFMYSINNLRYSTQQYILNYKDNSEIIFVKSSRIFEFIVRDLDSILNSNITFKNEFISGFGLYQKLIGKKTFDDFTTIKDENGHLHQPTTMLLDSHILDYYSDNLEKMYIETTNKGIPFLYVQSDFKYVEAKTKLPYKIDDKKNDIINSFLSVISGKEIPNIDLRNNELILNLNYDKMFYKTDHHWSIDYSFTAVSVILKELNELYKIDTKNFNILTNIDNYDTIIFEDSFLGSFGIKIGPNYAGKDDFKILLPKYDTDFSFYKYTNGELDFEKNGDFLSSLIDYNKVNSEYVINTIHFYMGVMMKILLLIMYHLTILKYY